jgi:hypothetical protein
VIIRKVNNPGASKLRGYFGKQTTMITKAEAIFGEFNPRD